MDAHPTAAHALPCHATPYGQARTCHKHAQACMCTCTYTQARTYGHICEQAGTHTHACTHTGNGSTFPEVTRNIKTKLACQHLVGKEVNTPSRHGCPYFGLGSAVEV